MRGLVLVALIIGALTAHSQPAFKSSVELVRIPVTVTQGDRPVEPGVLTAADFKVTENGVPQAVALFERETLPLSVCVVFDTSHSMSEEFSARFALASLRQLLSKLSAEDEVAMIAFAAGSEVVLPWTPAPETASKSIDLELGGGTSINDAVARALALVDQARNRRAVVLLITDGGENSSKLSIDKVVRTRRQSETPVYAFNVAPPSFVRDARTGTAPMAGFDPSAPSRLQTNGVVNSDIEITVLPRLVGDSGGVEYRLRTEQDVSRTTQAFVDDLRNLYTLGYTPAKAMDGKYRRVKIEVIKRGFKVRHRGGYLALPSAP
jgi:VWFA-related protein